MFRSAPSGRLGDLSHFPLPYSCPLLFDSNFSYVVISAFPLQFTSPVPLTHHSSLQLLLLDLLPILPTRCGRRPRRHHVCLQSRECYVRGLTSSSLSFKMKTRFSLFFFLDACFFFFFLFLSLPCFFFFFCFPPYLY